MKQIMRNEDLQVVAAAQAELDRMLVEADAKDAVIAEQAETIRSQRRQLSMLRRQYNHLLATRS